MIQDYIRYWSLQESHPIYPKDYPTSDPGVSERTHQDNGTTKEDDDIKDEEEYISKGDPMEEEREKERVEEIPPTSDIGADVHIYHISPLRP